MIDKIKNIYQENRVVIDYLIFGVLTTAVNYLVFFVVLFVWPKTMTVVANTIAWVIAFLFAYFTNRKWVFHTKAVGLKANLLEFWWFFVARVFSLGADDAIVYLGIDLLHQNKLFIKLLSQVVIVIINYTFSKWIFKNNNNDS